MALAAAFDAGPLAPRLSRAAAQLVLGSGQQLLEMLHSRLSGQPVGPALAPDAAASWALTTLREQISLLLYLLPMIQRCSLPWPQHFPATEFGAWALTATRTLKLLSAQQGGTGGWRRAGEAALGLLPQLPGLSSN